MEGWGSENCVGEAAAMALQEIAAQFARELPSIPGAGEWLARFPQEERTVADSPPPPESPRPVSPRQPLPARAFGLYFAGGAAFPGADDGHLADPHTGIAGSFGFTVRPWPHLAFDLENMFASGTFSAAALTPPGGFFRPEADERLQLTQLIILFQARPVLRLGPVEPYVAAGPALMFQRLTWSGSLFGIPGTIDERNDLTLGLGLAVGTDIRLARSFALGVRYRFLLAKNSFGPLSNDTASTTSRYLLASFAWYWPPDSAGQTPRPP